MLAVVIIFHLFIPPVSSFFFVEAARVFYPWDLLRLCLKLFMMYVVLGCMRGLSCNLPSNPVGPITRMSLKTAVSPLPAA